jgi:NTP pyrophosphatase (non-canonical NTP hydrolase)
MIEKFSPQPPKIYPSILLRDYIEIVAQTDKLPHDDWKPILMGLFGEVGSLMATAKKHRRENKAYIGYQNAIEEEFGDTLWYIAALCRRLQVNLDDIFAGARDAFVASDLLGGPISHVFSSHELLPLDETLLKLGEAAGVLLGIQSHDERTLKLLNAFVDCYLQALQIANVPFAKIIHKNIEKAMGRFVVPNLQDLPTFDSGFEEEEQLPQKFEIRITQRKSGRSQLKWNGVFIGDPLTDNILDPDDYRFHDVFHFSYAAILHWSPIFRGLIKQKRKSNPLIDEAEDGGRAGVIEEGITAWIFSCAKHLNYFEGQDSISFDLLKTIQQFVRGYEVEACPLSLWERAVLDGYKVFRQVRANQGGIVVGCRATRTIEYRLN